MIIISSIEQYQPQEDLYISVRDKEERVVDDALLKLLPYTPEEYVHHNEWEMRAGSMERFIKYIHRKGNALNILDIGCGNGWMSARLYKEGNSVTAVDLNMTELQQAETVFGTNDKLQWVYCNIMSDAIINSPFDIILLNASCQYFDDIAKLTTRLAPLLKNDGTIHLLDSFFYKNSEIPAASERSKKYYRSLGFPEMTNYYFHHSIDTLKDTGYKKFYPGFLSFKKHPQWWVLQQ